MKKKYLMISLLVILSFGIVLINNKKKYKVDNDSLAVFVDGERTDTFPNKNNYSFASSNCDNDVSIEWDNDTWSLYASNLDKKVKCNLYFQEKLVSKVTNLSKIDTTNIAKDDPDNNIRYIGANPDNYVYFNCSDYSNQSDTTCEKWRIIGVFNNVTKSNGSKENLVKIIREESIGGFSWDSSDSSKNDGEGVNNWNDADIMKLLNLGYDSESLGGSIYYNAKSGTCYNGSKNATTSCDFTSTGLKNDTTRNAIETVVWNLGGTASYNSSDNGLAINFYNYERGTTVYSGNPTTWKSKISLMYPSDYGYATSGGVSTSRASCLNKALTTWNDSENVDCRTNNYLFKSEYGQWTLTTSSSLIQGIFDISSKGVLSLDGAGYTDGVRPTIYLKANISIKSGNGEENTPYQLNI